MERARNVEDEESFPDWLLGLQGTILGREGVLCRLGVDCFGVLVGGGGALTLECWLPMLNYVNCCATYMSV
jgi:hypothetical protein